VAGRGDGAMRDKEWRSHLEQGGRKYYVRRVRDGSVVVSRPRDSQYWLVSHNSRLVKITFKTARQAMEFVDDAEAHG